MKGPHGFQIQHSPILPNDRALNVNYGTEWRVGNGSDENIVLRRQRGCDQEKARRHSDNNRKQFPPHRTSSNLNHQYTVIDVPGFVTMRLLDRMNRRFKFHDGFAETKTWKQS